MEDECLRNDCYAGLGFNEDSGWFAGKVVFRAKLELDKDINFLAFKVVLERAELGASSRFTRRFGSASFMRVKIPKSFNKYPTELMDFFRRPFIVSGKVFRAFLEKENNVFFYMTNEALTAHLTVGPEQKVPGRLSFEEFLEWHNPIDLNRHQVRLKIHLLDVMLIEFLQSVAKYASRFALGLSTSAPGLLIKPKNILFIDDIS